MSPLQEAFVPDWTCRGFARARKNFRAACTDAGLDVTAYEHPLRGPAGEVLATDVARVGPAWASRLLVLVSGMHGVEGYSGSGMQADWIRRAGGNLLPEDCAALLVHAINPWGMAHLRRCNEDNVDLCRNCLSFDELPATRPGYAAMHPDLVPGEQLGHAGERVGPYLSALIEKKGVDAVVDSLMGGQYEYPDGFCYGGSEPVWSNRTLREILADYGSAAQRACCIEFHTGLGPWAYGSLVSLHTGADLERVREFFGEWVVAPAVEESTFHSVRGHTVALYREALAGAEVTAVTLEFGTCPPDRTLALLLREHLLYQFGQQPEALADLRRQVLDCHHPRDREWQSAFWSRGLQVIRQAARCLARQRAGHV